MAARSEKMPRHQPMVACLTRKLLTIEGLACPADPPGDLKLHQLVIQHFGMHAKIAH